MPHRRARAAGTTTSVIQRAHPDVVLINEFDYDPIAAKLFADNYLAVSQNGAPAQRGKTVHFLVSHPTPPTFDGPEDRNGRRNHDEIRFWADYISPRKDTSTRSGRRSTASPPRTIGWSGPTWCWAATSGERRAGLSTAGPV